MFFFISQTFYISLSIKLIHAQQAYISMSCVKFKLSLGWNVACGRTGKLIAGSTVVWPRCVLGKCVWEKAFFSHTAGKKRLLFLTLYIMYVAVTMPISTMWKKINPFLFFSVNWNGIWNPFLLQFYVPIEEKETTDTFRANMTTSNKSISFPFFLWELDANLCAPFTQCATCRKRFTAAKGRSSPSLGTISLNKDLGVFSISLSSDSPSPGGPANNRSTLPPTSSVLFVERPPPALPPSLPCPPSCADLCYCPPLGGHLWSSCASKCTWVWPPIEGFARGCLLVARFRQIQRALTKCDCTHLRPCSHFSFTLVCRQ